MTTIEIPDSVQECEWFYALKDHALEVGFYEYRWVADLNMHFEDWRHLYEEGLTPKEAFEENLSNA